MSDVAVLIPWAGEDPHRLDALHWLTPRIEALGFEPIVGWGDPDAWCKAAAVADALKRTTADTIVVHDADVWCDALPSVLDGLEVRNWAVPHRMVRRLTPESTRLVLDGAPLDPMLRWHPREYQGFLGGGIVALRRDTYVEVPLDPRFVGWGHEDDCWAVALRKLVGPPSRGVAPLWHLWHPPQVNREAPSQASLELRAEYREAYRASRSPEAMRAVLRGIEAPRTAVGGDES